MRSQPRRLRGKQVFKGFDKMIQGDELMKLTDEELQSCVSKVNLFTRMFPEAKLRVVRALKANGEVVAMTGDGVNDGPALKDAHIGIAMGQKGSEIARQAAALILVKDDLSVMADAIGAGRRIYTNLKKAIQYIISIHIPIILTVFLPLAFGWVYPNIFSAVHIIFLELIMGPTCSIIYENEPMEANIMTQKPRPASESFFNLSELATSIVQGLVITLGALFVYRYSIAMHAAEALTRTMVFTTLIAANIFLTLINRSFYYSVFTTLKYRNKLVPLIIGATIITTVLIICIVPIRKFLGLESLNPENASICIGVGCITVIWYELVKRIRRLHTGKPQIR